MIDRSNILIHEFIGLEVEVARSTCRNLIGKRGRVVDETKNTIEIEKNGIAKMIPKRTSVFRFQLPSGERVEVDGRVIEHKPEDRPRRLLKYLKRVG